MATQYVKLASKATTGGHSYWREIPGDAILVADGSMRDGSDPTSTDDGRLQVDAPRIREEGLIGGGRLAFRVPLIDGRNTVAGLREAQFLADYFGVPLRVKDEGATYLLTREG